MKKLRVLVMLMLSVACLLSCCGKSNDKANPGKSFVGENITFSAEQYSLMISILEDSGRVLNPKSIINGKRDLFPRRNGPLDFSPEACGICMK